MVKVDEIRNRYKELDALRGIAALLVVAFHYTLPRPELKFGFNLFASGVELFFIISGFVTFMSIIKIKNGTEFIINRFCRLFPTYWVCVSITFVFMSVYIIYKHGTLDFLQYIGNLTMFQHYFNIKHIDGSYWTLTIEMLFYIFILMLYKYKLLNNINIIGLVISIISVMFANFLNAEILNTILFSIPILNFAPLFFSGIVFFKMYVDLNNGVKQNARVNYLLIIFFMICQVSLYNIRPAKMYFSHFEYAVMVIIYYGLFILFVNGMLNFIVSRPALFIGKISFALYLIHQQISLILITFLTYTLKINFWVSAFFITLPLIIILAAFITYFIEIPISKRLKGYLTYSFNSTPYVIK